ncbi:MAG: cytochrome c maturation protein CcmE [Ignavibacteria bacterium]|nr:cytochrome c maturation protein CcmE [Ignavibacteria bacterium]
MKNKYIIGGGIVVVFLSLMVYLFTQSNIQYENDFTKIMQKGKTVRATGKWIKERNYITDPMTKNVTFFMRDNNGVEMKVLYKGTMPNNFEIAQSIVVTGQFREGTFHARDILTKCPSKYQDQKSANS